MRSIPCSIRSTLFAISAFLAFASLTYAGNVGTKAQNQQAGPRVIIPTERTWIRSLRPKDFDALKEILGHEKVVQMSGQTTSDQEVRAFVQTPPLRNPKDPFLMLNFGIYSRPSGKLVGLAQMKKASLSDSKMGLSEAELNEGNKTVIGGALSPEVWSMGLATEVLLKMKQYAFTQMGVTELLCDPLETSKISRRVLRKARFRKFGESETLPKSIYYRATALEDLFPSKVSRQKSP